MSSRRLRQDECLLGEEGRVSGDFKGGIGRQKLTQLEKNGFLVEISGWLCIQVGLQK